LNFKFKFLTRILSKLLLDSDVHLVKETLVSLCLVFPVLFLITGLIAVFENNISIELEVEHQLVNIIFGFEKTFLE
jgi:hypothetical protein